MKKKILTLLIVTTMVCSLIGCNNKNVESPTNETNVVESENTTPSTSPTPTEFIDYNNPLEVGGVSGMGVSNVTITPKNEAYANDYKGIMDYAYEPLNNAMISSTNYVYSVNENESYIETNIELANKQKYSFYWISETSMGTTREIAEDGLGVFIYNKEKTSRFSTWNGSSISDDEFSKYSSADLKSKVSTSDKDANIEECWKQDNNDKEISIIYAIDYKENDKEYVGFRKIIINKDFKQFVQFEFVQLKENYNRDNAYKTICSIGLKNENDTLKEKIMTVTTTPIITNESE